MADAFCIAAASNAVGTLIVDYLVKPVERLLRPQLPGIEFFEPEGYLASKSSTSAFNEIMEALKGDEVNMIGVWGMGGVGKTTLVTQVGNKAKSLQLFQKVIKVVVSQTPNIENIQDKIADILELELKKKTKAGKAEELWLRLKNEEKILIILDDMWNELNLIEIGIPLGENHKGCTIVLTTRLIKVCDCMKSQVTVSLNVLDNGETWTLFRMNASLDNASPEIIDVANEVAKECDGLPIAIVTLARALRNEDLNGWKSACHKLKRSRLMDIENVPKEVQKNAYLCLEMSYNHLGSETTKSCLLLCALYPEDYSIDVEDLVRYAWGLRLYQNAGSIQQARREVFEAINNLKDSCLLLEDHQESYNLKESYLFLEDDQERYVLRPS